MDLSIELFAAGESRRVKLADISRTGMFLRLSPPLPVGESVHVAMYVEGRQLATAATVVHGLREADACALGRRPGIGIAFDPPSHHGDALFMRAVDRLLARRTRVARPALHVVVADASTRMLERLSTELAEVGATVATATNGLEAIGACLRQVPDLVIVDRSLPVLDGLQLVDELARRDGLQRVPVIIMSADASDLALAFDRGAKDFIHKPFSTVELVGRCHRVLQVSRERVILRGDLAELGLPALLVMLEQERKSGRLVLAGDHAAWIDLANGAIVGAGSATCEADMQSIVMTLLDWRRGSFELTSTEPSRSDATIALPITYALIEHARQTDERRDRRFVA